MKRENIERMWLQLSVLQFLFFHLLPHANGSDERIINGTLATLEDLSYTVSIRDRVTDFQMFGLGHLCGGTLIRRNVVLTAAHCCVREPGYRYVLNANSLYAILGQMNRYTIDDNTIILKLVKIVAHNFTKTLPMNDIALLFLSEDVPIGHPIVRPMRLTQVNIAPGTRCQVNGWGRTETTGYPPDLMKFQFFTSECRKTLVIPVLCAGTPEGDVGDSCKGDSGGPLICNNAVSGIVSRGKGCKGQDTLYTNVFKYLSWIEEHIKMHNGEIEEIEEIEKIESSTSCLEDDHFARIFSMIGNFVLVTTYARLFGGHL